METSEQARPLTDQERVELARKCFREFYAQCFWFMREDAAITEADLPWVADKLRKYGNRRAFLLAAHLCP